MKPDLSALEVGHQVVYVDPTGAQIPALVTAIWGDPKGPAVPCINLVYVSTDPQRTDNFGRQMERQTSLVHRSAQPAHGNYYMLPDDEPNPIAELKA